MSLEEKKIALQEQLLELRKLEIEAKLKENDNAKKKSKITIDPVLATIIVALIGFLGTAIGTAVNISNQNRLEQRKFEADLIKKSLDEQTQENKIKALHLLTILKLIKDDEVKKALEELLKDTVSAKNLIPVTPGVHLYSKSEVEMHRNPQEKGLISFDQLKEIFPSYSNDKLNSLLSNLNDFLPLYKINTPLRISAFLAQMAHESADFTITHENLNYPASMLPAIFPSRFNETTAKSFAHHPIDIANRVYANRMGNGDTASGDGWKYRGRGYLMMVGKDNYKRLSIASGKDFINFPDSLDYESYPLSSAGWYWQKTGCNEMADKDDIKSVTKHLIGGYSGMADRTLRYEAAKKVLTTKQ